MPPAPPHPLLGGQKVFTAFRGGGGGGVDVGDGLDYVSSTAKGDGDDGGDGDGDGRYHEHGHIGYRDHDVSVSLWARALSSCVDFPCLCLNTL